MRNAEIGMRNNAQRQWWASSAPLCKGSWIFAPFGRKKTEGLYPLTRYSVYTMSLFQISLLV